MKPKQSIRVTKNVKDQTDWAKIKTMQDSDITFTKDAPRTSPDDWADAIFHRGLPLPARKEQIALRVEPIC